MNYKLSDKELFLLSYLEGTDKSQLLSLAKDSTTRNYGELATIPESTLIDCIHKYLTKQDKPDKIDESSDLFPRPS